MFNNACFTACPPGWYLHTDELCYQLLYNGDDYANVYKARQACLSQGADIANIPDGTIDQFIRDSVTTKYPVEVRRNTNKNALDNLEWYNYFINYSLSVNNDYFLVLSTCRYSLYWYCVEWLIDWIND